MITRCIFGDDERVLNWMKNAIGNNHEFRDDACAIGIERNGDLVGAAAFDTFSDNDCMIHLASDGSKRWLNREFIQNVFIYMFIQCKFRRISAVVTESNHASRKIVKQFGFQQEGVLREGGRGGEDLILYGLIRRECKFIQPLIIASDLS